jgi:hypothetical protein
VQVVRFRRLIETCTPHQARVELFARQTDEPGWTCYGLESDGRDLSVNGGFHAVREHDNKARAERSTLCCLEERLCANYPKLWS